MKTPVDFLSPISLVKGFGPKRAEALRESGIATVGDLLYHFPLRYIDRSSTVPLKDIGAFLGRTCTVSGVVEKAYVERGRRGRLRVLISDGTGRLELLWFAGAHLFRNKLSVGSKILATGKVSSYRHLQMVHPLLDRLGQEGGEAVQPFFPVYSLSEQMREAGLSHRLLGRAIGWALDGLERFPRVLPDPIEKKHAFPPLADCLRGIHAPADPAKLDTCRNRLRYEELYRLALTLRWSRRKFALPGRQLHPADLPGRFRATLPFALTDDQEKAIRVLYSDAASGRRMHRLLQGDVGSGKTLVAFFACFPALASGLQVAWLAPTEVLALQTCRLVSSWLSHFGQSCRLLKNGITPQERRHTLDGLASGKVRFAVGTHALLQPQVKFRNLGMIVIDEQHKFGASQRLALQEKDTASDFLLMSATPIPQTLAQTLYGDLDIVTIEKGPPGRQPAATHLVPEDRRRDMEQFVMKEITGGKAAVYWVVPRIEQDDGEGTIRDAESTFKTLSAGAFSGVPAGCMHGRMSSSEKERVMDAFAAGRIRLLVSTTVVEVGVDVPHATIMVIENPERFGLAQLHQLRGRVGRGSGKSWCFLLAPESSDDDTRDRLSFFCSNHDGFKIAEKDLLFRGPGEVAGFRQTGWDDFKLADIVKDAQLFREINAEIDQLLHD